MGRSQANPSARRGGAHVDCRKRFRMRGRGSMQELAGSLLRPRRGSLFVPASSPRMLEKAAGVAADEVVLDLEDSVAADSKDRARDSAVGALRGLDFAAGTVAVRINAVGTPAGLRDLLALGEAADARFDTLVVPKVETAADV